jgi:fumarylacetoacetate (FAA) hydrolase
VKLCRFELREAPGLVRSGIVHGAKVYETDGANPIAVHEADAIRPLPPVGQPGSVRYFRTSKELHLDLLDETSPIFAYLNPTSIIGPSKIIPFPTLSGAVDFEPCIGAVMAASGANIPVELADDMILGYTLAIAVALRDVERQERALCLGPGRSFDTAIALGPVLTTPDELEETIESEERGKRFALSAVARVNGVELRRGAVQDLPFTFAEAIAAASESCAVREGDLILLGPLVWPGDADEQRLSPDDQVQCAVERLGTLSLKLAL